MRIQGIKDRVAEDGGLPEEAVTALTACQKAGYTFAVLNGETSSHHTPCHVLYRVYLAHARTHNRRWEGTLNPTEFGVVLNVACDNLLQSRQLRLNGKRVRVYSGVEGPKSFHRRITIGRPPRAE